MLLGDRVVILLNSKPVRGQVIAFTENRVKILVPTGKPVLRKKENVTIDPQRQIYYAGDTESEESVCCGDYTEVCSRQPFCQQVVNFFYWEQRNPTRQLRFKKDYTVLIDAENSTPEFEQIATVLKTEGDNITVYNGGSRTKVYEKRRLLRLRPSKITEQIIDIYREEAIRNDIEFPERFRSLKKYNKKQFGHTIRHSKYEW